VKRRPIKPSPAARPKGIEGFFADLGPGLITGCADDDPSGISTYSMAGALFGYSFLWSALLSFPLMVTLQTMCGRLGLVTGRGLAGVVKHFKFEHRGKRRIHKKPSNSEIVACKPWLEAELAFIQPEIIVCLGATAAQAVIGKNHRLLEERGNFFPHAIAKSVMATVHPSSILRAIDSGRRRQAYRSFVDDLKGVRRELSRTQIGRTKSHAADR